MSKYPCQLSTEGKLPSIRSEQPTAGLCQVSPGDLDAEVRTPFRPPLHYLGLCHIALCCCPHCCNCHWRCCPLQAEDRPQENVKNALARRPWSLGLSLVLEAGGGGRISSRVILCHAPWAPGLVHGSARHHSLGVKHRATVARRHTIAGDRPGVKLSSR